jgi:hypothetical protein
MMPTKKDMSSYWTKRGLLACELGTTSNRYVMPTSKEIFDAIGHAKVFNTWDFKFKYHQLPIKEVDKQKITLWRIDEHGNQWQFLSFKLKNTFMEFQRIMDKILAKLDYT